jgi:hypothetical protein
MSILHRLADVGISLEQRRIDIIVPLQFLKGKHVGHRSRPCRALLAVAAATLTATAGSAVAQAPAPTAPGKVSWYGDPGAPNLSGIWVRRDTSATGTPANRSKEGWQPWPPPLKTHYLKIWKQRLADAAASKRTDDPVRGCMPPGMPRYMAGTNNPLQIIQTPGRVTLYRDGSPVRRIWVDGRTNPAPRDLEVFSNGNAVGHYEGTDLVTEVVGIKDQPIDNTGVPHSDDLKIVERFQRIDAQTLRVQLTLTDAIAFTRPMTSTVLYTALEDPYWAPKEFLCTPVTGYLPDTYVH